MSKKATEFQKREMSRMYRGTEIFKSLNTGWIDGHVACVREWVANIFFFRKGGTTIMIDAGYNYDRLAEKMGWLGIDPDSIRHILITHQDTDHVGAVEADSPGLFKNAFLYVSETENRYLTGEVRRRVLHGLYKLPQVTINNKKALLKDGEVLGINDIKIECLLVPGHTWGHMVYLIDEKYLFTGDALWFGADSGYSFISTLAEDNALAVRSLAALEAKLRAGPAAVYYHRTYRLDGRPCLCPPERALLSLQKESPRPQRALRRLRRIGRHAGAGAERFSEGRGAMMHFEFRTACPERAAMLHGGLAGDLPDPFSKEVRTARRRPERDRA